jgi:hypothetical protein
LGRHDEARRYLEEVTRVRPDFSLAFVRNTHLFGEQEIMARFFAKVCARPLCWKRRDGGSV